jgi:XTP/dITP diphosphohydrolase
MPEIVIASANNGKIAEIKAAFDIPGMEWITHRDVDDWPVVDEDLPTFEENAVKKAATIAAYFGKTALGDDSGLEVDALRGKPGVLSARYAGPESDAAKNNIKLLAMMEGVPYEKRTARFRCVMALASPDGKIKTAEGEVKGHIVVKPAGAGGFGYDPLFIPDGFDRTMAELSMGEKNAISHRGRALAALRAEAPDGIL